MANISIPGGRDGIDVDSCRSVWIDGCTLSNGDEVQIGKFRLVFIAGPRPEEEVGRS